MNYYTEDFYKNQREISRILGKEIIPIIFEYIKPKSVIDIGCGVGGFLSIFKEMGISDILGVDGDWIKNIDSFISKKSFYFHDLT